MKCEICEVDLPPGDEARELHESGKRHVKMSAQRQTALSLQDISVFVRWPTAGEVSNHGLLAALGQFGCVDRILFRPEGSFAIVEFKEKAAADSALVAKNLEFNGVVLSVEKRKVKFSEHQVHKATLDVQKVVGALKTVNPSFVDQTDELIKHMLISDEEVGKRTAVLKQLEQLLGKYLVSPSISMFGSSITGVGTVDSDIDASIFVGSPANFCAELNRDKYTLLTCDPKILAGRRVCQAELLRLSAADRVRFVCKIINEVRKDCGWIGLQRPVLDARCPVVRFIANRELLIDLSVNNRLGCAKSQYMRDVIHGDRSGNLRRILVAFRFWALSNGLFEPPANQHMGHFNAYILNMLVIYYLVKVGSIPKLQFSMEEEMVDNWRIDYSVPEYDLSGVNMAAFFKAFFIHVVETPLVDTVYGVDDAVLLKKQAFSDKYLNDPAMKPFKLGFLNIQDPLELSHNVGQNVGEKCVSLMKKQMMLSLSVMKKVRSVSLADIVCLSPVLTSPSRSVASKTDVSFDFPALENPSLESLKRVVCAVAEEVLKWEMDPLTAKRMKLNEPSAFWESQLYVIGASMWIGRRNVKRKIQHASPEATGMELEKMVSQEILESQQKADPIGKVVLAVELRDDGSACLGLRRLEGNPVEVTNAWHFLCTLISNNWQDIQKHL